MTDQTVSSAALAQLLGVTARTVTDLARRGIVVRDGNRYAVAESVRRYCRHLRELANGRGGESAVASATAQRARLAKAQADLVETKAAALKGDLVPIADVEAEWSAVLRQVRAGILAVPSRCSARLPHLSIDDLAEISYELRQALAELST